MQGWRAILAGLTPNYRARIIAECRITERTFRRWISNDVPHASHFQKLLLCLPRLLQACMFYALCADPQLAYLAPLVAQARHIPPEFGERIICAMTLSPPELRFSTALQLALMQMRMLLDPEQRGICICLFRCVQEWDGHVRTLRLCAGLGSSPWLSTLWDKEMSVGYESLVGRSVQDGVPYVVADVREDTSTTPYADIHTVSVATNVIGHDDRVAGALVVCSTQVSYFTPAHCDYIKQYCDLLGVLFAEREWYHRSCINLVLC